MYGEKDGFLLSAKILNINKDRDNRITDEQPKQEKEVIWLPLRKKGERNLRCLSHLIQSTNNAKDERFAKIKNQKPKIRTSPLARTLIR